MINVSANCFALLDDRSVHASITASRLYLHHQTTLTCWREEQLPRLIEQMQEALRAGSHAVALLNYELGEAIQCIVGDSVEEPLAQILLFEECQQLCDEQVGHWLQQQAGMVDTTYPSGIANLRTNVNEAEFAAAISRIHAYIEAGDTYQVNYTYRLHFDVYGHPLMLYRQLRQRQAVPYGALIALPDGRFVLSLSPELFVRHVQGILTAQPMKGTAAASGDAIQDQQIARALAHDPKNRAENVMIVDLLRNDLGRVARPGSVHVSRMFDIQHHNTVLQMTSTVQAILRDDVTLLEVITSLYPCGSITGAPKHRTMQIINELELAPRRLYTGAIGWFDAATEPNMGAFCLSVPIRTLLLETEKDGVRAAEMGVGAGIVYDSIATEEYAECVLKARFLTDLRAPFSLFETMYATRKEGCRHLALHLQRLQRSAQYFGFLFDMPALHHTLAAHCSTLNQGAYRLRLALSANGMIDITSAPLLPLSGSIKALISPVFTKADDVFLRHKTTVRSRYDQAWRYAEQRGAFDMLFFNRDDELTEGGRSNVFVKLNGHWYTPPLSAGVLPGVMRHLMLQDETWTATERRLTRKDVQAAEQVMLCNALHGAFLVELIW